MESDSTVNEASNWREVVVNQAGEPQKSEWLGSDPSNRYMVVCYNRQKVETTSHMVRRSTYEEALEYAHSCCNTFPFVEIHYGGTRFETFGFELNQKNNVWPVKLIETGGQKLWWNWPNDVRV